MNVAIKLIKDSEKKKEDTIEPSTKENNSRVMNLGNGVTVTVGSPGETAFRRGLCNHGGITPV